MALALATRSDSAIDKVRRLLVDPDTPLWLVGTGTREGLPFADEGLILPEASVESVLLRCPTPVQAIHELLDCVAPRLVLEVPGLDQLTLSHLVHWDWLGPPDSDPGIRPVLGDQWWGSDQPRVQDEARSAFLVSAAATAWLLDRALPKDDDESGSLHLLLIAATRILLDTASVAGQVAIARDASRVLLNALLSLNALPEQRFTIRSRWPDTTSEAWIEFSGDPGNVAPAETGGIPVAQTISTVGVLHGLLAALSVPADHLSDLPAEPVLRSLLSAAPGDALMGGAASPDALLERLIRIEKAVVPRTAGATHDVEECRERGRQRLVSVVPKAVPWLLFDDFCYAFGRPDAHPARSVASDRAREVEAMMHRVFPGQGLRANFGTLADDLKRNVRRGAAKVITAEEGRLWAPIFQTAQSSRNRLMHLRPSDAPSEEDLAFWMPERFSSAQSTSVFALLKILETTQIRRAIPGEADM